MSAESKREPGRVLTLRGISCGDVAGAAFVLCAISGMLLAGAFDPRDGARSIAEWLLGNPAAVFLRNVHYWTAQLFLVFTVLHIWDHFHAATEQRVKSGVWLRLVLSIPVIAFLMLSGFLLRGDADARQAQLIFTEAVNMIPFAGPSLATLLVGAGDQLMVVYMQHAASATIIVWLVIIEHARQLWPKSGAFTVVSLVTGAVALVLSPGLHDGLDALLKGPWYFLGLQEILHWTTWPLAIVVAGGLGLALAWLLPQMTDAWAARTKALLLMIGGGYVILCGVGLFMRGENWSWRPNWPSGHSDLRPGLIIPATPKPTNPIPDRLPIVLGRPEGCLVCHGDTTGLGNSHRPESIGCASCHAGDLFTLDKQRAHSRMIRVPGNLADAPRTCGQAGCHTEIIPRVEHSIMTTFSGVISANRRAFGEPNPPTATPPHVRDLRISAADIHLRQLCVSCHLGQEKLAWGSIVQESRGGGCNACHLIYDEVAAKGLTRYEAAPLGARGDIPKVHPALSVNADNNHCFGCHSRSGRISTNYEGWHELHEPPPVAKLKHNGAIPAPFRQLDDGRYFTRMTPDIHQERGLDCIDCHTATEVMGDGRTVAHKSEQVQLRCEDCHARSLASTPAASLDPESVKLLAIRKWTLDSTQRFGTTRSGSALVNVTVDASGVGLLRRKRTGQTAELRAPLPVCVEGNGHVRLTCNTCHSGWAPRCISCHTSFKPEVEGFDHLTQQPTKGAWTESSDGFDTAPPTLGIRADPADATRPQGVVDTFVPGMIMELDRNMKADQPADPIFRRMYARTFAHTIRREARSCVSCHNDPVALGYGRGTLRYLVTDGVGRWQFTPAHAILSQDGLPGDAWTGFLQSRTGMLSTRDDVRPFSPEEQRRILQVGACLTCHAGDSEVMKQSVADFATVQARRSPRCAFPEWPDAQSATP